MTLNTPAAALNSALLLLLPMLGTRGGTALVTAIVTTAGLSAPALEAGLRALWPSVLPDLHRRRAVLALDTGTQGLLYITGPLLVAALAWLHGPALALAVTAALGLAGTGFVTTAKPSRRWRSAPAPAAGGSARLAGTGFAVLCLSQTGLGFAIGAVNVLGAAMAGRHQMDMLSGLLPAAFATGSFLGGLAYGRRTWPGTTTGQLLSGAAAFLASWLPLIALLGPLAATAAVALPGAFLTVVVACSYLTTDTLTPPGRTSEAYAWLLLSIGAGQAAGTALSGQHADHLVISTALPAAGAAFTLITLLLGRRALAPAQHEPRPHPTRA